MMKKIFIFVVLASGLWPLASSLRALELSLEENRGESGTIGYVDIDRVFKEFSGTLNAREEFISEIKKKEETILRRKMAVYTLKAEIAKLKQEKEFALTLPGLLKTREQLEEETAALRAAAVALTSAAAYYQTVQTSLQAAASSTDTVSDSTAAVSNSTAAVSNSTAAVSNSTAAVSISTDPAAVAGSTVSPQAVQASTAAGLTGFGIDMPGISSVPTTHFKFSISTSAPEIDAAINAREAELKDKEDSLKLFQRQAEVELLGYESHKSELILGRIYLALKELAVKEEVSVIVDKRSILFGHSAVDLTDKLLKKLEESPI
ncbi:MAG: OmpH family outer membrane protein [Elusimicrobia bacterium]|nr:OmpH family outer membrane protein [Elusimicrobiota bacterium]